MGMGGSTLEDDDLVDLSQDVGARAKISEVCQVRQLSARQVKNSAGGYVWVVDDVARLRRFLFLGSDNVSVYRAVPSQPIREHAVSIDRLIAVNRGVEVVNLIRRVSIEGRAAKQQPILFALALCARSNDENTKKAAYSAINDVCRIPTHLFMFVKYAELLSAGTGWGRAHKRAISGWYEHKATNALALGRLVTKYNSREGWCHKDLFKLTHTKPRDDAFKIVVRFVVKGLNEARELANNLGNDEPIDKLVKYLEATYEAKRCQDESRIVELVRDHRLEREHLPTECMNSVDVWKALVENMQMTAIIRNLGKLTSIGMCDNGSKIANKIVSKLADQDALKSARVHPFDVLVALDSYRSGTGDKGHLTWSPNKEIVAALDKAFYLAFKSIRPTGKRFCLALDVSGSMNDPCVGSRVTCSMAAAAMLMVTARTEVNFKVMAFAHKLIPLYINKNDKLTDVMQKTSGLSFCGTDCALPMLWAKNNCEEFDVFIVYTDYETWFGKVHPAKALQDYRVQMDIPDAKLIVVGMSSNGFSIADPDDFGMLDVVGFDSGAPETIAKFSVGEI